MRLRHCCHVGTFSAPSNAWPFEVRVTGRRPSAISSFKVLMLMPHSLDASFSLNMSVIGHLFAFVRGRMETAAMGKLV